MNLDLTRRFANSRTASLTAGAAILLTAAMSLVAYAQHGSGPRMMERRMMDPGAHLDKMASELDLSEAQRTAITAIFSNSRDELETNLKAVADAQRALHEAVRATPIDEAKIRALAVAVGTAQGEAALTQARLHQKVAAELTPEQAARFTELRNERFHGMGEGHPEPFGKGGHHRRSAD